MRLDEEEVLIRDDSGLLHSADPSYPVRQNGWWKKFRRTMSLTMAFFALGLCFAVPGPTLLDLGDRVQASVAQMMMMFAARSLGYLLGAIMGGVLFDCFDKQLLLFCTLLISSIATVAIPWSLTLVVMATMFGLQGITMGVLDTGGNVFCVRLWGKMSGPYIQMLHFAFGIGAFIAPLLATPFLSIQLGTYNSSLLQGNIPVAVSPHLTDNLHHNISARFDDASLGKGDLFQNELVYGKDVVEGKAVNGRVKRSDGSSGGGSLTSSTMQTTPIALQNVHMENNETPSAANDVSNDKKGGNIDGDLTETIGESEDDTANVAVDDTQTTTSVYTDSKSTLALLKPSDTILSTTQALNVTGAVTSISPSTAQPNTDNSVVNNKKPKTATDDGLKPSFIDGEKLILHLNDNKDEGESASAGVDKKIPVNPNTNMSTVTTTTATNGSDGLPTSSPETDSKRTENQTVDGYLVNPTVPSVSTTTERNETITNSKSTVTANTGSPLIPLSGNAGQVSQSTTVNLPKSAPKTKTEGTNPPTTSTHSTTTEVGTSTKLTSTPPISTTTEPLPSITKAPPTTSTAKATTTSIAITTTTSTATTTSKTTTISTATTTTSVTNPPTAKSTTTPVHQSVTKNSQTTSQPKQQGQEIERIPPPSSTSNVSMPTSPATSTGSTQGTEKPMKPPTTKDSFLTNAIQRIKNLSRIKFAYLIIGLVLFINAVIFLVLYCKDKGRLASLNEVDDFLAARNIGNCSRNTITVLMGLFLLCYMGLEVTYGALVTSFVVDSIHWTKTDGATVAAIFWGSLATGRGFSIFIARCCGPIVMLSIDLVLMVLGGLVLSIGLYFYTKLIWLGTLVLGLGMSSVFPAGLSWAENYIHLTGKTTAIFTLGSGLGQIIFPLVTGYFFEHFEKNILMQVTAGSSVFLLILFIVIQCFAMRSSGNVLVHDRNGFLPLEDAEDDNMELDLIHFDKSQRTRRRDGRARGETEYKTLISDLEDD